MSLTSIALATAGAAVAATTVASVHEAATRQAAERFAAAALESLLNAIDANDADTGAHVRRVATYALILADAADLSTSDKCMVERIALFHDIGKIHEALFDILHVERKLTPTERRSIITHPQRGADVLAPLCGFYPELPEGVLCHHEKWNGSGYPRRLKGTRIPLSARIVAIADTFDAVTHRRRYSTGRSLERALEIILDGRGKQFDPELVDLFAFPPVFEEISAAQRKVVRWRTPVQQRRTGEEETHVPEINFRWRPGRTGGRGHAVSDRPRRKSR